MHDLKLRLGSHTHRRKIFFTLVPPPFAPDSKDNTHLPTSLATGTNLLNLAFHQIFDDTDWLISLPQDFYVHKRYLGSVDWSHFDDESARRFVSYVTGCVLKTCRL